MLFFIGCSDDEYTLHLTIDGKGRISLNNKDFDTSATVVYEDNEVVTVRYSNTYDEWEFEKYTGDLTGTSSSKSLTMTSDKHFTAIFSLVNSVSINGKVYDSNSVAIQNVTVTSGSGTNQVTAITNLYGAYSMNNVPVPSNKRVYLKFIKNGFADQSYYFDKEKSDMSLENIILLREYNLEIQNNFYNSGSTAPIPGIYTLTENSVKVVSASHSNSLTFDKWSGDIPSSENALSNSISITMDMNRTISADFLQFTSYSIQLNWNSNHGTVAQIPEGDILVEGSDIYLSNNPEEDYVFSHWLDSQGQLFDTETLNFSLNENVEYTCVFIEKSYRLTLEKSGEGSYRIDPVSDTLVFLKDTQIILTAIPASGWIFRRWDGSVRSSNQKVSFVMDANKTVFLVFEQPNATFMGQVTDGNNDGLENVKVMGGNQSTLTDENGFFLLDKASLPNNSDTMTILFAKHGYCLHSEICSVYDQIQVNVFPQLSKTCLMLESIIQTLKILSGQTSDVLAFDIDANNQPNLSEVLFMMQHVADY